MDGQWGEWDEWSKCPVTCGGGEQKRERKCNNPKPSGGGKDCQGDKIETKDCNTFQCGRKYFFRIASSFFTILDASTDEDIVCDLVGS